MPDVLFAVSPPVKETKKAWGFETKAGGLKWVPKSQAHLKEDILAGVPSYSLLVAAWLNEREKLSEVLV